MNLTETCAHCKTPRAVARKGFLCELCVQISLAVPLPKLPDITISARDAASIAKARDLQREIRQLVDAIRDELRVRYFALSPADRDSFELSSEFEKITRAANLAEHAQIHLEWGARDLKATPAGVQDPNATRPPEISHEHR